MKILDEILISTVLVLTIIFLLYGLKKAVSVFSLKTKISYGNRNYRESKVIKFLINIYGTGRRILSVFIFIVLILFFYLLSRNIIFSLFVSLCLEIYILDLLNGLEEKRKELIHSQLIEFISNMTVLLKAGKTVRSIFKESANWFKDPLSTYLLEVANELELNSTLDEALDRFSQKCRSREANLLVSSLKINNRIGGDLISILDNIADSMRHNLKLKSQIKTMSLQSRYSGNIISIFPIIVLVLLYIFMNKTVVDFFSTSPGVILLFIGGVLEIAGVIVMKKITSIGK
ncbi:MAG: hypothetical protein E3J77_01790 [Actinobacteria bacterium]|nr:MAG: hypothetical protein E3J77_01790 [Actinomycetota bacterium]